jgi:hypothetical protein
MVCRIYGKLKTLFGGFVFLFFCIVFLMSSISFFKEGDILYSLILFILTLFSLVISVMFFSDLKSQKIRSK